MDVAAATHYSLCTVHSEIDGNSPQRIGATRRRYRFRYLSVSARRTYQQLQRRVYSRTVRLRLLTAKEEAFDFILCTRSQESLRHRIKHASCLMGCASNELKPVRTGHSEGVLVDVGKQLDTGNKNQGICRWVV